MNIILTGFMGTGKTAAGKRLAKRLGWKFIDVDELIEKGAKASIADIFTQHGESVFRRLERAHINRLVHGHHQVIATGGGAVTDPLNRRRLRASGVVVCLIARPRVILERVGRRIDARPMLTRKDPLARIRTLLNERAQAYKQADLTVDTSDLTAEQVVERIWRAVSPCLCKSWQYLLDHADELSHRYGGKYVVVVENKIVASGATHLDAYRNAKLADAADAGIYYIPQVAESLTSA